MRLLSTAFENGSSIPARHSLNGENASPPLRWEGVPLQTRALALIVEDPDASSGTFLHWMAYNIPAQESGLEEGFEHRGDKSEGTMQGRNDFDRLGYDGPAPPPGKPHRYVFRLFALDRELALEPGVQRQEFERTMRGHVLEEARLTGTFAR